MFRLKAPLDVQIEITELCNQRCRHCYNFWRFSHPTSKKELDVEDLTNLLHQLYNAKVGLVTFTGGEPMLRKNVLFESIREAHSLGIETGLNSTATLITKGDAMQLAKSGLDHSLISILGPEKVHNSIGGGAANYRAALNGIRNLQEAEIPVSVNMVVSKMNLYEIFNTASILKLHGVDNFCAGPMLPSCTENISICLSVEECKECLRELMRIGKELSMNIDILEPLPRCLFNEDDEDEFVRFFGNRICSAAVSSCVVSSTGHMRPCIYSDEVFGNVFPNKFLDVWENMASWASPDILPAECRTCRALMVCEGGCRMSAKITSGSSKGPDMYMTEPILNPQRASLVPVDEADISLNSSELLRFNKRCILRSEQEGYIAYVGGKLEYLSQQGFQFISLLQQLREVTCRSLASRLKYPEEVLTPVLKRLLKGGILIREKKGGDKITTK